MIYKIEPIELFGGKIGQYLKVYTGGNEFHAMILDAEENELLSIYLNKNKNSVYTSNEDCANWVAKQLNLTIQVDVYKKLDQLLIMCNDIKNDILSRMVDATDVVEEAENNFIGCLSTHIPGENQIMNIKSQLRIFDHAVKSRP